MTDLDDRLRGRVQAITERTGTTITYRRITRSSGPAPLQNPPIGRLTGWTAGATASSGLTSLPIQAGSGVVGRMVAGDQISFPGHGPYTLATMTSASAGAFVATITTPTTEGLTIGDPATVTWSGDTQILARISAFPRRLVDGNLILATDLQVVVPATQLPVAPVALLDQLVIGGVVHIIVSAQPAYVQTQVGLWNIQARVA